MNSVLLSKIDNNTNEIVEDLQLDVRAEVDLILSLSSFYEIPLSTYILYGNTISPIQCSELISHGFAFIKEFKREHIECNSYNYDTRFIIHQLVVILAFVKSAQQQNLSVKFS